MTGPDQEYRDLMHTARMLLAALGERYDVHPPNDLQIGPSSASLRNPAMIAAYFRAEMAWLEQEQLRVIMFDAHNRVLGSQMVYQGGTLTMLVRPSEVFREAVRRNAMAIAICHNHPTYDATPSAEDLTATARFVDSAYILGIELLDHVIVGGTQFSSIRENHRDLWTVAMTRHA